LPIFDCRFPIVLFESAIGNWQSKMELTND